MLNDFDLILDDIILAFAIKDKKHMMELCNSVDVKYFDEKKRLFEIVKGYFIDPKFKEIPTLEIIKEKLEDDKHSKQDIEKIADDYSKIKELSEKVDSAEFSWHLNKLRIRYNQKIQKECAEKISTVLSQNIAEDEKIEKANRLIKEATIGIDSIYRRHVYKEGSLDQSARERFTKYEFTEKNPDAAKGVLTGFKEFDRKTNGLHPGELMIVAGETGCGKSVYMHNIGVNAYLEKNNATAPLDLINQDSGHNVLYYSLEMPKESIERRIDSCMGDLCYNHIRDGALSK